MLTIIRFAVFIALNLGSWTCIVAAPAQRVSINDGSTQLTLERVEGASVGLPQVAAPLFRLNAHTFLATTDRVIISSPLIQAAPARWSEVGLSSIRILAKLERTQLWFATIDDPENAIRIAHALEREPQVLYAQPDFIQIDRTSDWRQNDDKRAPQAELRLESRLNIQPLWKITTGRGVRVAVIDDGFDFDHEDLKDVRIAFQYDVDSQELSARPRDASDRHGTGVASLLFAQHNERGYDGLVPDAELIAIRRTHNRTSDMVLAFYLAFLARADVVNCSFVLPYALHPIRQTLSFVSQTGRNHKGTIIVAAAGNQIDAIGTHSLAALPEVVTVNALDVRDRLLVARSPHMDITAPTRWGVASAAGTDRYEFIAGTSGAAPIVTGVAALLLSTCPGIVSSRIVEALHASANKQLDVSFDSNGFNERAGYGLIDPIAALQSLRCGT